ncbi:MAG TPA: multicopper oxidase domain-containing protein [Gaiellaceae bacterium]|jgi:FtsP/CotA-like multicopper oxidase with cupredoxin domain|nr:multicopper oxidase domain-containing protein [Gaiellaceae bacterium]
MKHSGSKRILVVAAAIVTGAIVTTTAVSMTGALRAAAPAVRHAPAAKTPSHAASRVAAVAHPAKRAAATRAAVRTHVKVNARARHVVAAARNSTRRVAAVATYSLCAKAGTLSLPGGVTQPIWGFATKPAGVDCADPSITAQLPGPQLDVAVGTDVSVTVTNALAEPISLEIPQLSINEGGTEVAAGGSFTYTFTASRPGTFLYDSPSNAGRQRGMGLFGPLVVRPSTAGQAYDAAASAYTSESVLVLSEIDPGLNADPDNYNLENWKPQYWLINGKAYPDTAHVSAAAGSKLLLRYINAGLDNNTMTMLGMHARLTARDGWPLANVSDIVAETIPSGQSIDEIASVPAGSAGSSLALYNRQLHLSNGTLGSAGSSPGGMLTFVDVTP